MRTGAQPPFPGGESSLTAPSSRPHRTQDRGNTARLDTEAHFRTDPSYLPELRGYLDRLLADRERVRTAVELEEWARAEGSAACNTESYYPYP
jgi:hypothetical protein